MTATNHMHNPDQWLLAAQLIRGGELVVFPTDTVYGVGCDPYEVAAIARIYEAKGRDTTKAIPLLLASAACLGQVALEVPRSAHLLGEAFWPGALTIVIPRRPELPQILSGTATVAVRVPDHDPLRTMIEECGGAIAATSANRSGQPDATNASDARAYLGESVALVVDGGDVSGGVPSTVVDCTTTPVRILREGAIPAGEIRAVLGESHDGEKC